MLVLKIKLRNSIFLKVLLRVAKDTYYFIIDTFVITKLFLFSFFKIKKILTKRFLVVTAADEKYFKYVERLIKNLKYNNLKNIVVYDLGFSANQISKLQNEEIKLIKFNFENYPSFISDKQQTNEKKLGAYAWKAAIIKDVLETYKCQVVWLDSANLINFRFFFLRLTLDKLGYFTANSRDSVGRWTFQSVKEKLNLNQEVLNKQNLNAAVIGFDYNNSLSTELLNKWFSYCMQKDLITPEGSNKTNHRWDQTLLSIVLHSKNLDYIPKICWLYGIKTHQWIDREIFIVPETTQEDVNFRENWYLQYGHYSTNTFSMARKIVFLNLDTFLSFPKMRLRNKLIYILIDPAREYIKSIEKLPNWINIKTTYIFIQNSQKLNIPKSSKFVYIKSKNIKELREQI